VGGLFMQSTKEGYLLTRNVIRVECRKNKVLKFMKFNKLIITISVLFLSLIITEGILMNEFISILKTL
jgi:hypothetical protein